MLKRPITQCRCRLFFVQRASLKCAVRVAVGGENMQCADDGIFAVCVTYKDVWHGSELARGTKLSLHSVCDMGLAAPLDGVRCSPIWRVCVRQFGGTRRLPIRVYMFVRSVAHGICLLVCAQ